MHAMEQYAIILSMSIRPSIPCTPALLVVDMQYDFLPPHGALAVAGGEEIVEPICAAIACYNCVAATQDFHPKGHKSFASTHGKQVGEMVDLHGIEQRLWPEHCVQGSFGAAIESRIMHKLQEHKNACIVEKGTNVEMDSYSGFFENDKKTSTPLHALLQERQVQELHVCGLASDYCVKYTVLDALTLGYKVTLLSELTRAVNIHPNDEQDAIAQMRKAGATIHP